MCKNQLLCLDCFSIITLIYITKPPLLPSLYLPLLEFLHADDPAENNNADVALITIPQNQKDELVSFINVILHVCVSVCACVFKKNVD